VCTTCCEGYYCPAASLQCVHKCEPGHYCPPGTKQHSQPDCPKGTYNSEEGSTSEADCKACDPGHYCPNPGMTSVGNKCDAGWYCRGGAWPKNPTDEQITAANETWFCSNSTTGGKCPVGHYCTTGSDRPIPCEPGYFCGTEGLKTSAGSGECNERYYCSGGASSASPNNDTTGGLCPPGHYCPRKTATPKKCPPGTFSSASGNSIVDDCEKCLEGKYCDDWGMTEAVKNCSEGFYCPKGQNSSAPAEYRCTPGHYCPEGSKMEIPCASGTYQNEFMKKECDICPERYFCNGYTQNSSVCDHGVQVPQPCPVGHYCPPGMKTGLEHKCPKGTFSNKTKLNNYTECTDCPVGKYCETEGLHEPTDDCAAGYYCIAAAATRTPNDGVTGKVCPKGEYCEAGKIPQQCPSGTYNNVTGLGAVEQCQDCPGGQYCELPGQSEPAGNCSAGYFCSLKAKVSAPPGNECTV